MYKLINIIVEIYKDEIMDYLLNKPTHRKINRRYRIFKSKFTLIKSLIKGRKYSYVLRPKYRKRKTKFVLDIDKINLLFKKTLEPADRKTIKQLEYLTNLFGNIQDGNSNRLLILKKIKSILILNNKRLEEIMSDDVFNLYFKKELQKFINRKFKGDIKFNAIFKNLKIVPKSTKTLLKKPLFQQERSINTLLRKENKTIQLTKKNELIQKRLLEKEKQMNNIQQTNINQIENKEGEAKEAQEVQKAQEAQEDKGGKETKKTKEAKAKEVKETKEAKAKEAKETKEAKSKEVKETKEAKAKEAKEAKETKEAKEINNESSIENSGEKDNSKGKESTRESSRESTRESSGERENNRRRRENNRREEEKKRKEKKEEKETQKKEQERERKEREEKEKQKKEAEKKEKEHEEIKRKIEENEKLKREEKKILIQIQEKNKNAQDEFMAEINDIYIDNIDIDFSEFIKITFVTYSQREVTTLIEYKDFEVTILGQRKTIKISKYIKDIFNDRINVFIDLYVNNNTDLTIVPYDFKD